MCIRDRSNAGAQRASSSPETAAQPASASSVATPATGASAGTQGWSREAGSSTASAPPSQTISGSAMRKPANGGTARDIPEMIPPTPRCIVNQTAVRPFAAGVRAGPWASSPASTPHSDRTAPASRDRVSGNRTAVRAASGSPTVKESSCRGRSLKTYRESVAGPTTSWPTKTYGMASAPPRIRWTQRRRARRPNRNRPNRLTPYDVSGSRSAPRGSGRRGRRRGCRRSSGQRR